MMDVTEKGFRVGNFFVFNQEKVPAGFVYGHVPISSKHTLFQSLFLS